MRPWRSTFLTNTVILGSGLAGGILAARLLGAEDRGLLAVLIYWPHFIAGIAAMGLNEGIAIRTAESGSTNTLRATTFAASIALAFPVGIVGFFLLPMLLGASRENHLLFSQLYLLAFLPITFLAQNFLAIEQGEFRFSRFNGQRMLQSVAYPLLLLGFWLAGVLSVENAAVAVLSGTAVVAFLRVWYARAGLRETPAWQEATQLFSTSFRLHVANVATSLSMQLDKMALVLFSDDTEMGLYVVAIGAAGTIVSLFVQTYINIMLPTAAQVGFGANGVQEVVGPLRRLVGIIVLSTGPLIVVMPHIVIFVFGEEFEAAALYAQLLLVAFAFVGVKKALVYLLRSWREDRPAILGEALTALVILMGAYFAVQWLGTKGLCLLVVLAHAAGAAYVSYFFLQKAGLTLRQFVSFEPLAVR